MKAMRGAALRAGALFAACLACLALPAWAGASASGHALPAPGLAASSPCPLVFRYEPSPGSASGWAGVVRLLAPPKFSALRLSVALASPEHLPAEPAPGTLTLRGGVPAARALVRAAQQGRRRAVEYEVRFSCAVTTPPALVNLTVNGRVFCSAAQEPADTRSTITLVADLETGLDWASASDDDFGVVPEGNKAAADYGLGVGHEVGAPVEQSPPCDVAPAAAAAPVQRTPPPAAPAPPAPNTYAPRDILRPHMYVLPSLNPSYPPQQDVGSPEGYDYDLRPSAPSPPPSTAPPPRPSPPPPPPPTPQTDAPPPPQPHTPYPHQPESTPPPAWTEKPSLLEPDCGRASSTAANPLVTRGAAAVRGRWPWLVALFKKLGRRDQLGLNFECGASLVSRKHVVTAAHCVEVRGRRRRPVDASLLVVYLGKHDLLSYTEPGQQTAEVDSVRLHPDYGRAESPPSSSATSSYDNDIALLVLTERVEPTKHIRPVCLWDAALASVSLDDVVGKIGAVPGWGKDDTGAISNEIHVANMPIVSQETCLRSNVFYHAFTNKNTFCAGFRNGTSVCNGDSGGGLFLKDPVDGRYRIRGIVSVSMFSVNDQSCDAYNYAVFTDVAKYLPWLFEQMYSTWESR